MEYPDNIDIRIIATNTYERESFEKACALFVKRVQEASRLCKTTQIKFEPYWKMPCVVWLEIEAEGKDEFGTVRYSVKVDASAEQKDKATEHYTIEGSYRELHFSRGNGVATYAYTSATKGRDVTYTIRYGAERVVHENKPFTSQYKAEALNGEFKKALEDAFTTSFFKFHSSSIRESE